MAHFKYRNLSLGILSLLLSPSNGAIVVAGWDSFDSNTAPSATVVAAGVAASATVSSSVGTWSIADSSGDPGRGSSGDGTWGTFDGNGAASSAVTDLGIANMTLTNGKPDGEFTMTIINNGAQSIELSSFHMDAVAFRPNAARTYSLSVLSGSDISIGTVFESGAPLNNNSTNAITQLGGGLGTTHDVHDDIDIDLSGLADMTLDSGETAIIQVAFTNGTGSGGGHHLFIDNIAVSGDYVGTVIPEASSILFLGLCGFAFGCRRRR